MKILISLIIFLIKCWKVTENIMYCSLTLIRLISLSNESNILIQLLVLMKNDITDLKYLKYTICKLTLILMGNQYSNLTIILFKGYHTVFNMLENIMYCKLILVLLMPFLKDRRHRFYYLTCSKNIRNYLNFFKIHFTASKRYS